MNPSSSACRSVFAGLALVVLAVVSPSSSRTFQENVTETLVDIERQLARAWVESDLAFIEALLADDWTVIDARGQVLTKRQVLDDPNRAIESMAVDDVVVRDLGEVAVVTGRSRTSGTYAGTAVNITLRFTDVFVRRCENWQVVASHGSRVPD